MGAASEMCVQCALAAPALKAVLVAWEVFAVDSLHAGRILDHFHGRVR